MEEKALNMTIKKIRYETTDVPASAMCRKIKSESRIDVQLQDTSEWSSHWPNSSQTEQGTVLEYTSRASTKRHSMGLKKQQNVGKLAPGLFSHSDGDLLNFSMPHSQSAPGSIPVPSIQQPTLDWPVHSGGSGGGVRSASEICGRTFQSKNLLEIHYRTHTGEKPHVCRLCGKSFAQVNNLNRHMYIHSPQKQFACPICHKNCTLLYAVKDHLRILHRMDPKTFLPHELKAKP